MQVRLVCVTWNVLPALACLLFAASGCGSSSIQTDEATSDGQGIPSDLRAAVSSFCGGCHNVPDPATFPRDAWYAEIEQGYQLFYESGRTDLTPPPMHDVVKWYREQAPETLILKPVQTTASPVTFRETSAQAGADSNFVALPGVSHIRIPSTARTAPVAIRDHIDTTLFCDMSRRGMFQLTFAEQQPSIHLVAELNHPAHVEPTDLDGDGRQDYVVAVLGSFQPGDHQNGEVIWLRPAATGVTEAETLRQLVLLKDVGRVADVQPGDFDGDGDQDLIVAEFGWRKTGRILLLRQTGLNNGIPEFETQVIDKRHGTIHVPVTDLDQDGDLDFVALISQEHEEISAYLNRGDGVFERQVIHLAGDPSFGSSGIQLVDLDADGDLDVLYTNGDVLDSDYLKPYHAIQWLQNSQDFPFRRHHVTLLPGAYRAQAADMDGDGDLDIVASAWISERSLSRSPATDGLFDTLIWLEQTEPTRFQHHSLKRESVGGYMAIDLGDIDQDGDQDIVGGRFGESASGGWLEIFVNESKRP